MGVSVFKEGRYNAPLEDGEDAFGGGYASWAMYDDQCKSVFDLKVESEFKSALRVVSLVR